MQKNDVRQKFQILSKNDCKKPKSTQNFLNVQKFSDFWLKLDIFKIVE